MPNNRQIQYTPEGEQIIFRSTRWGMVFVQSIWVIGVAILVYWSAPAIQTYFEQGEITGAAKHLNRFNLSDRGTFAAMIAWCVFLVWWGPGALYEILKVFLYRDRFLLRSDALVVQRRKFRTREFVLRSYEPMALRLGTLDGALEAKTKTGEHVLTEGGTLEDRRWLLEHLQQRYRATADLPATTANTRERIGTYIVERRTDGTMRIRSSGLSTIGCGIMAAVVCVGLLGFTIRLFMKGSGAGLITLMFTAAIAFAGLNALNRRTVEASRGKLHVSWSSPVGRLLQRFVKKDSMVMQVQFGEGQWESDTGTLTMKTTYQRKSSTPNISLVLLRKFSEEQEDVEAEDLDEQEDLLREDLILNVHGAGSEYTSEHLLRMLSETTGFPVGK